MKSTPAFSRRWLLGPALGASLVAGVAVSCATTQKTGNDEASHDRAAAEKNAAMHETKRVPVPLIEHQLTPEEILARGQAAEAKCEQALAAIVAIPDAERTFDNTVEAFEQSLMSYIDTAQRVGILKEVHTDEAVRGAAATAEENAGKYLVKVASRRELYQAMKGYLANQGKSEGLDPAQKRLLELTMRDFRRNGLELSDEDLAKLVAIRTRMTELSTQFQQNLNENASRITLAKDELAGLPEAFVARLEKTPEGGVVVTTKYPDFYPLMENAKSGEARRRMYVTFQSREADRNMPLLQEALKLRDEQARLLGYPNHADFVTEEQMARSSAVVKSFLASLKEKLLTKRDADYVKMTELKRGETRDPQAKIQPWDVLYYLNEIKKRDYTLDTEKIREFFPSATVIEGMFQVYEKLLAVDISKVEGAQAWAPEVTLYEIRDRPSGEFVGYFYTDLFPRKGKYGHAAAAPVTIARRVGDHYDAPIAVMLANFNPPSADRPSLLSHDEVKTLFHEFGHIMHQTLTAARYGSQSGTSVARDFVEVPSQMLENWVFEKEVLDLMSGHFQDPSKKLPEETIRKIKEARAFDAGYRYTRQVFLATFDQTLHTSGPQVDVDAIDQQLFDQILGMQPVKEAHFAANFGHLMGGYDAGYYGYLWAEVFADDLFTRFKQEGVLNSELGRKYREIILARGREQEPGELLREFLGREPNNEAFLGKIGIQ